MSYKIRKININTAEESNRTTVLQTFLVLCEFASSSSSFLAGGWLKSIPSLCSPYWLICQRQTTFHGYECRWFAGVGLTCTQWLDDRLYMCICVCVCLCTSFWHLHAKVDVIREMLNAKALHISQKSRPQTGTVEFSFETWPTITEKKNEKQQQQHQENRQWLMTVFWQVQQWYFIIHDYPHTHIHS